MHILRLTRIRYSKPTTRWITSPIPLPLEPRSQMLNSLQTQAVMTSSTTSNPKRAICPTCCKPTRTCLCTRIQIQPPGLDNPISVTVLQHRLEGKHPLNSTRILKLGLRNVTVASVSDVNSDARFCIGIGPGCGVESFDFDDHDYKVCLTQKLEGGLDEGRPRLSDAECCVRNAGSIGTATQNKVEDFRGGMDGRGPVIDIGMAKKGAISSIKHIWMSPESEKITDLNDVLICPQARDVLAKGFVVRKLQKREVGLGRGFDEFEEFRLQIPSGSLLLFPSEEASSVDELKVAGIEVKNLIVLDGTWMKAKRMYRENPWLRFLPHLKLDLDNKSLYGEVRSQPKAEYLSTVESVVYAMKALGNDTEVLNKLLIALEAMVDDQRRCKDERLRKVSGE